MEENFGGERLFVCEWVNEDTVVFAGNGKISVMKLKF
jgi:hypothetical protein